VKLHGTLRAHIVSSSSETLYLLGVHPEYAYDVFQRFALQAAPAARSALYAAMGRQPASCVIKG
jgi:hypothetical protein